MTRRKRTSVVTIECPRCHEPLTIDGPHARAANPYGDGTVVLLVLPEHLVSSKVAPAKTWTKVDGKRRMIDYRMKCPESGSEVTVVE